MLIVCGRFILAQKLDNTTPYPRPTALDNFVNLDTNHTTLPYGRCWVKTSI
jgi:hypothetical protein